MINTILLVVGYHKRHDVFLVNLAIRPSVFFGYSSNSQNRELVDVKASSRYLILRYLLYKDSESIWGPGSTYKR